VDTVRYFTRNKRFLNGSKGEALRACELLRKQKRNLPVTCYILNFICVLHVYVSLVLVLFHFSSIFCISVLTLLYDRLFLMLQRFPVESKGRRKKLQEVCILFYKETFCIYLVCSSLLPFLYPELIYLIFLMQVGYVTTICFSCFLIRCVMVSPFFSKD